MDLPQVFVAQLDGSCVIIVMKRRLEPVVVQDAAGAADPRRYAVGALLDPAGRFGIDRGTVANPLHDGVQVCQDLRVDAGGPRSIARAPCRKSGARVSPWPPPGCVGLRIRAD